MRHPTWRGCWSGRASRPCSSGVSDLTKKVTITYAQQREPLGNGHAVLVAKKEVGDEPFAVLLPDDVIRGGDSTIGRMIDIHRETGGPVIGVAETPEDTIPQKGVVAPTRQDGRVYEISGLVEKPSIEEAPSNLAVVGRYVLPPETFFSAGAHETRGGR